MEKGKAEITVEYTQQKLSSTRNISPFSYKKKKNNCFLTLKKCKKSIMLIIAKN